MLSYMNSNSSRCALAISYRELFATEGEGCLSSRAAKNLMVRMQHCGGRYCMAWPRATWISGPRMEEI